MATSQLPAKINSIRTLFESEGFKSQLKATIPKHLSVERLLRVAMTAIRTNPKLADCTQKSLLACVMGLATLGLECEPFLGQAYLIPYKNKDGGYECTLIPGYRGYIALARRSGEVQSVSAQVVYTNDHFGMEYGLNEALSHVPASEDRGEPKGAYVIFRYKDGSHSFDYMSVADINKIRERSMAYQNGIKYKNYNSPWFTDWDEMAKKTVIRRHIKLVPLSIEMATASALEEKFNLGESQVDLLTGEVDSIEGEITPEPPHPTVEAFVSLAKAKIGKEKGLSSALNIYLAKSADVAKKTTDEIMIGAVLFFEEFWKQFMAWNAIEKKKEGLKNGKETKQEGAGSTNGSNGGNDTPLDGRPDDTQIACPKEPNETRSLVYCRGFCISKIDCESWKPQAD